MADAGDLPAGWTAHKDPETNFTYYFHAATGESRWEKPQSSVAHKPAAPAGAPTQAQQVLASTVHCTHRARAARTTGRSCPARTHAQLCATPSARSYA
jgi:hypothetical protein